MLVLLIRELACIDELKRRHVAVCVVRSRQELADEWALHATLLSALVANVLSKSAPYTKKCTHDLLLGRMGVLMLLLHLTLKVFGVNGTIETLPEQLQLRERHYSI